ncbi:MAG: hypothetical protein JNM20_07595 [Rhizobiales bacterium]|nr:hypothetical protein [Hyphomicrobiales bacterium]
MILNLTAPTFVVVGAFNRRIFQPSWIARWLYEFAEGADITFVQLAQIEAPARQTIYISDVGISATNERLEVYINSLSEATKSLAETVLRRLFTVLPHTPVKALGINFHFDLAEATDRVISRIRIDDGLDAEFPNIKKTTLVSTVEMAAGVDLNFSRSLATVEAAFDFNFHHPTSTAGAITEMVPGSIDRCFAIAQSILRNVYELENYQVAAHVFEAEAGAQQ